MVIQQKRIRNIHAHLKHVPIGVSIIFGVSGLGRFPEQSQTIGFTKSMKTGEKVLPPDTFGTTSHFNAEGKYLVHRDQPKETAYRMAEWRWTEWRGPYNTQEMSKIVEIPYKRYPRTFISPPAVELCLASVNDKPLIVGPLFTYSEEHASDMVHVANLFLEIFGECWVFTEKLDEFVVAPAHRLNWHIFPPGKRPWAELHTEIKPILQQEPKGNRPVIKNRFATMNKYGPEFVAVGQAGFHGYVVFGFPNRDLYILESTRVNNATYVFSSDWERLSQMTKAEILNNDLQTDRIIHRKNWHWRVNRLLNGKNTRQRLSLPNANGIGKSRIKRATL